jgi:hypothetical protein
MEGKFSSYINDNMKNKSVSKYMDNIGELHDITDSMKKTIGMLGKDELKEQGMESLIPQLKFEIETIRTTKYDKNIDRYECAADFKMIGNANTTTLPITYTVESTDKKGEFYVTVDGF